MLLKLAFAILLGMSSAALAQGFEIVIPGRAGVPIIINGIDASYAVLEGDFGLGKGVNNQPALGRPGDGPAAKPQAAEAGRELSSILGCRVGAEPADAAEPSSRSPDL